MRIKTRLRITTGIALGVALFIALSLIWSFSEVSRAERSKDLASEMRKLAYERTVLRDDYLLRKEDRARKQWIAKTEDLRKLMKPAEGRFHSSDEQAMMKEAREDFEVTRAAFTQVMENRDPHQGRAEKAFLPDEAEKITLGQVFMKAYALENDLRRLFESAEQRAITARSRAVFIIVLTVLGGIVVVVVNSVLLNRSLSKGLAEMGRGVAILGAGDLDHRIDIRGDDELSDLARTSNEMAAKLSHSYTSVENLQKEIVERKRAEEALRKSEALFRTLADSIPNLAWWANADGYITWYNRRWYEYTGTTPEQMEGWGWQSVHDLKMLPKVLERWKASITTGEPFDMEFPLRGADGIFRPFLTRVLPLKDSAGQVLRWFGTNTDISMLKQTEEALRETNEYLDNLFNYASAPIIVWDPLLRITRVNRAFETLAGKKAEDVIGHSLEFLFPSDQMLIRKTMSGARWEAVEINIVHSDGSNHVVLWDSATLFARDGITPVATIAQGQDITERKKADETLRDSEERLHMLIEGVKDYAIYLLDVNGNVVSWNAGAERLKGYQGSEIIGRDYALFFTPEDRESGKPGRILDEAKFKGHVEDEGWRVRKDGSRFWADAVITILWDPAGHPRGFAKVTRDITEHKRVAKALQESETRLREAQKMAQLGYWNWNVSTGIVEWSEEVYKIFHLDPNKFTPHIDSILALSPWPEDHQRDKELIRKAMESHEKGAYEQRFLRPDGSTGYYNSTFQGKYDERGKLVSLVGTVLDITERKKAEEEIGKLNEELEQRVRDRTAQLEVANKELEGFSYSVSHDLRAPLRHLTGFVEMLAKRATTLDDKSRHYLEVITTAASQMGRLIDDLLSFSRMGRAEMMRTRVDLKSLLEEAIRDLHTEVKGRNIHWDVKDLPEVSGDPAMLKLVIVNILLNAIKFTRPREQALIEVGSEQTDGEVIVSVRDNGVGFDPKYTDKLFNLFQRLHRAEEFEGTGVGLANVRRIIHRHGGRTWAEGALNAGAVIRFSLPNKKGESI